VPHLLSRSPAAVCGGGGDVAQAATLVQHQEPLAQLEQLFEQVRGDDQRPAAGMMPAGLLHPLPGRTIQALERLIQQQHLRFRCQCPGQAQQAALSVRKGSRPLPQQRLDTQGCSRGRDPLDCPVAVDPVQPGPQQQLGLDGEGVVDGRLLGGEAQVAADLPGGGMQVPAPEADDTGRGLQGSSEQAQQGGLAGTVGALHPQDAPGRQHHIDITQCGPGAEPAAQAPGLQQRALGLERAGVCRCGHALAWH